MLFVRQENLMFDVVASCSVLQLAKLPSVTRQSPSLTRSNAGSRDRAADATDKLHRRHETSRYLGDAKPEPARSGPGAGTTVLLAEGRCRGKNK